MVETDQQKKEREQREQMEIAFKVGAGIWLVGLTIGAIAQGERLKKESL